MALNLPLLHAAGHHQHGKWEARIGRVDGNRYLYLGTFHSEEAAARAYDLAALRFRGKKVTRLCSVPNLRTLPELAQAQLNQSIKPAR